MRRLLGLFLILALAGAGATGCGGGSSGDVDAGSQDACAGGCANPDAGPPDATPTVTVADVCGPDGALSKLLQAWLACNPALDELAFQGQVTPQSISDFCNGAIGDYLGDGSIALPSYAELQTCLDYISNTSCTDLDPGAAACDLFRGAVADNGACEATDECGEDSYCMGASTGACGTCQPRLADGMTCARDDECLNRNCIGTQCGAPSGDGDPCQNNNDCIGQRQCDPSTNKCGIKTWALNDVCAGAGDCGILTTDLYCKAAAPTGPAGQCAQYLAIGDPCTAPTQANPLSGCDLREYDWCNTGAIGGAKCSAPNLVQEGQQCGILTGNKCAAGLVCSNPIPSGSNPNPGICYTPGVKDDACGMQGDVPCGLFLGCVANQCEYNAYSGTCPG